MIKNMKESHWREIKSKESLEVIEASDGLYLEAVAESTTAVAGERIKVAIEAINRSDFPIQLESVAINDIRLEVDTSLENNLKHLENLSYPIPADQKPSNPYWLDQPGTLGMYKVAEDRKSVV